MTTTQHDLQDQLASSVAHLAAAIITLGRWEDETLPEADRASEIEHWGLDEDETQWGQLDQWLTEAPLEVVPYYKGFDKELTHIEVYFGLGGPTIWYEWNAATGDARVIGSWGTGLKISEPTESWLGEYYADGAE